MNKNLTIVYASDNNFAEIMGISLVSLFENNKDADSITTYILSDKISNDNKAKLNLVFEKYSRKEILIEISEMNSYFQKFESDRWPASALFRLYISSILPDDINKILYIDCDTIVKSSLESLWNTELHDKIIGAVNDCIGNKYKENLGLKKEDNYFNSGVILIDLKKWREQNIEGKLLSYYDMYSSVLRYPDQDILNGVLSKNMLLLPSKYNSMTVTYDFTYENMLKFRKPFSYYSEHEVKDAKQKPVIIHFTSSFLSLRPWIEGCKHQYVDQFLKYKSLSPWSNEPQRSDKRNKQKKAFVWLYNKLPVSVAVSLTGCLHSKVLPMWYSIKKLK